MVRRYDSTADANRSKSPASRSANNEDDDGLGTIDATILQVKKTHFLIAFEKEDSDALEKEIKAAKQAMADPTLQMDQSGRATAVQYGREPTWRIDQSVRDTTAKRQLHAIKLLGAWADEKSAPEKLIR